jgi:type I restriction enzyme, S subunit
MKTEIATKFKETEIGIIPEKWDVFNIQTVSDVVGGGTPTTANENNFNGEIPWITPRDLSSYQDRFISRGERCISEDGLNSSNAKLLPVNTVLLTTRAPVGYLAIAKNEVTTNQGFHSLIPNNKTDSLFLFYLLKNNVQKLIDHASGSTFQELNGKTLKSLEFAFPQITEQKQIAEILSSLDDKIELNRKINANLEKLASSLFKKWFVDIGNELPEGWRIKPISSFGEIVCGKTPSKSIGEYFGGDIPFIKIPDMHGNVFIVKTEDTLTSFGMDSQKNKTVSSGSICVSCIATVGLVSMPTKNSQTNQQINSIIPSEGFYQFYLFHVLKNLSGYLQRMGSSGSATLNVNTKSFASINIVKPDDEIFKKFDTLVRPIFEQIKINTEEASNLSVVRDSLLPRLMSGKIRVN